ncbi:MAG: helix-turn-helix domain-containing protein [Bacteroidales bacterium]|nr:helix-turn-helix domain-containing protein [Bacteroidales bacterium]
MKKKKSFEILELLSKLTISIEKIEQQLAGSTSTNEPEYLSIDELAKLTGLSKNTIYQKRSRREIPAYKFGRELRFKKSDLNTWMETKKHPMLNLLQEVK